MDNYILSVQKAGVMGPNVPLHEGGQLVGFFSPESPQKYTGEKAAIPWGPKQGADG